MLVLEEVVWVRELRCTGNGNGGKGCLSLLEVERSDLRFFEEQVFPWRTQPAAVTFRCPSCEQTTDIAEADWPHNPKQTLKPWSSLWRSTGSDDTVIINTWIVETT